MIAWAVTHAHALLQGFGALCAAAPFLVLSWERRR